MLGWMKNEDGQDDGNGIVFDDDGTGGNTAGPVARNAEDAWFGEADDARQADAGVEAYTTPGQGSDPAGNPGKGMPPAHAAIADADGNGFMPSASGSERNVGENPSGDSRTAEDGPAAGEGRNHPYTGGCPYILVKADDDRFIPKAMNPGDAGFDLAAAEDVTIPGDNGRSVVGTGIALAIPRGYAGLVLSRSGLAAGRGIVVLNAPGLIDSGYRDELKVILINTGHEPQKLSKGDRIAQLVIQKVEDPMLWRTGTLPQSKRGMGGLGSTGM